MKNIAITIIIVFSLCFYNTKIYAQLHSTPSCGQNFNLNWTTSTISDDHYWPPGKLSNTYTNVDGSRTDVTITFTGETSTLGFWAGQTPKVGTQSSYLYKGIDLLSNGFSGTGITCTITFSKPLYAYITSIDGNLMEISTPLQVKIKMETPFILNLQILNHLHTLQIVIQEL